MLEADGVEIVQSTPVAPGETLQFFVFNAFPGVTEYSLVAGQVS